MPHNPAYVLPDYANERMDREMDKKYQGSRTVDVDLTHSTYELTPDLGFSAFRDNINVLNITDVPLTVVVLPLSYGDETVGSISARLATPERKQIEWAMQEAAKRGTDAVHSLDRRSDLVFSDSLNVTVSDVLLIITLVQENEVSVLEARRVSATENLVLAVLPGLLSDRSGMVPRQPGGFAETVVKEILDRMAATPR